MQQLSMIWLYGEGVITNDDEAELVIVIEVILQ